MFTKAGVSDTIEGMFWDFVEHRLWSVMQKNRAYINLQEGDFHHVLFQRQNHGRCTYCL